MDLMTPAIARHAATQKSTILVWVRIAFVSSQSRSRLRSQGKVMYALGEGVPKNDAEAVAWFRRAAEQGLAEAQGALGVMYALGEGVSGNDVDAYFWSNLAAAQGQENAGKVRDIVEERMTREQIAEAQRRLAAWKPKTE
ncbi:MAG: sel1 repeat family protein, partial [Gammaproteobacteria bacterium]|nr:sel1 repeat family protein [Gammaproteobacteria bacterium]